jgi:DNA-binding NarL/FixJ family response regulator
MIPRRILVIDDHVAVRRGLASLLAEEFPQSAVSLVACAQDVLDGAMAPDWDIVILDLNLPGRGGLEIIRDLKDRNPAGRVLVYTVHPEDQLGVRALRAGADGYVSKDRPADELVHAVRALARGRRYISAELAESLARYVVHPVAEPHDLLSDREFQILRLMAGGKTPSIIAQELGLSIKTISTYRSRILEKLRLETTADLIRYAVEKGLG